MKKWLLRAVLTTVALAVIGVAGYLAYFEAVKRAWVRYNEYDTRSEGILQVGDPAPDLTLRRVGGEAPVRLSSLYRRRPLVLVFGSYT